MIIKKKVAGLLRDTYNNQHEPSEDDVKAWMRITDENQDGRVSV